MPYVTPINTSKPGCFLFLVDQSGSTKAPVKATGVPLAEEIARVLNEFISTLLARCSGGGFIKDRVHTGILGYFGDDEVRSLLPGGLGGDIVKISALQTTYLGMKDVRIETVVDGKSEILTESQCYWIEPKCGGRTPMNRALRRAKSLVADWIDAHNDSYPPLVVNITDGVPTDGKDLTAAAAEVTQLKTEDGGVLLLNVHLTPEFSTPLLCPSTDAGLPDDYAKMLWRISSPLPESMQSVAPDFGLTLTDGSRGMAFNASISDLVRVLDFGSYNV